MRLQAAADELGVHYQTAYGWVRNGQLPARKMRGGYEVSDEAVRAFAARRLLGREPASQVKVRDWAAQAERLYQAIARGQETQAITATSRLAGHVTMTDLCDRVIGPALRRIGDEWEAGRISVAREHRASAICERIIASGARQAPGRPRGEAVVATPPGERHALPALMAAACLRENRWHVHHLSADLPGSEIAALAAQVGARLVVLSTATTDAAGQAADAADLVRAAVPGVTVLVGRPGDSLGQLRDQAAGRLPRSPGPASARMP